ncbi:MAG: glycogen/starch synthase, partial [Candidatus Nanoarchaeia archaeon]
MKVLMFGWEFPPYKSGGLGTACYDLTKGLSRQGVDVTFVMPSAPDGAEADFVKLLGTDKLTRHIKVRRVKSILTPYQTSESYHDDRIRITQGSKRSVGVYGKNMYEEVGRYTMAAELIAEEEDCDVIHAHDWMTYQAGMRAKAVTGKPLVVHIHATEF